MQVVTSQTNRQTFRNRQPPANAYNYLDNHKHNNPRTKTTHSIKLFATDKESVCQRPSNRNPNRKTDTGTSRNGREWLLHNITCAARNNYYYTCRGMRNDSAAGQMCGSPTPGQPALEFDTSDSGFLRDGNEGCCVGCRGQGGIGFCEMGVRVLAESRLVRERFRAFCFFVWKIR